MRPAVKRSILNPDLTYSFRKYFEMNVDLDDLMAEFDVVLERRELDLPRRSGVELNLVDLHRQLRSNLQHVDLTSEAARRESLVFPILSTSANKPTPASKLSTRSKSISTSEAPLATASSLLKTS